MVKQGDWVIVGDLFAEVRHYTPIVGRRVKVLRDLGSYIQVQVYDDKGFAMSTWNIQRADAHLLHQNSGAIVLLKDLL